MATLRFERSLDWRGKLFEATIRLSDLESGAALGQIVVDKNSWPLGGGLAAGQTAESFMPRAAKRIAEELAASKQE